MQSVLMENDKKILLRAVEIARNGIQKGGGPFGAVITSKGKIISESFNRVVLNTDPTAHAEIIVIREAASILNSHDLSDCTLYTSCEPCPMCLGAIYWAGIKKVVYGCDRNDAGEAGFNDKMIYEELMRKPPERKITFLKLRESGGKELFAKWDKYEKKIPY